MERLNWHIADELSKYADIKIVAPAGAAALRPAQVELIEVPLRPLWRFLLSSAWQACRTAYSWRPDIVLAGSGLTAPAALIAAKASGARACAYLHGLDVAVRHPIYQALWLPAIRQMSTVITNSRATAELAHTLNIARGKLQVIHPGVQLPDARQSPENLSAFRRRYDLGNSRILLSVGRLTSRKGLREFVEKSLPSIVGSAPDTLLVVIGPPPSDALHANEQTRESIQAAADAAHIGKHVRFLGAISQAELACAYECASLHVFPVRNVPGDPEGFGMVAIEAAAHGTPTAGFATAGVVDAVANGQSGYLVPTDDYPALTQTISRLLSDESIDWKYTAFSFARKFAWPEFGLQIWNALSKTKTP